MEKEQPYSVTMDHVLDYTAAACYIDEVLGFSQRQAHERFPEQGAYLDFWHYVLDAFIETSHFHNDSYASHGPYSFEGFAESCEKKHGAEDWRTVIAKVWAAEYPDPPGQSPDARGYELWMSW